MDTLLIYTLDRGYALQTKNSLASQLANIATGKFIQHVLVTGIASKQARCS